jgi:uncharacterized protein YndB with AHSA1/START domain
MHMIEHEVWINADRNTVFQAITTKEGLDAWWGTAVAAEPRVGAEIEFDHGEGADLRMRITELVADERVAWKCVSDFSDANNPASEWLGHHLIFELRSAASDPAFSGWLGQRLQVDPDRDGTIVRFQHNGWQRDARWTAFCNAGWGATLNGGLKDYCEQQATL